MRFVIWLLVCLVATARGEVELGNEVLARAHFKQVQGKRIGLLTNRSGVDRKLQSTVELLRAAEGVKLVALFGPEHGIYGDVPAGNSVESRVDVHTGLPVHSLYGATTKPTREMLNGIDALVYDLQDTGCRSYTYISTMGLAMEACAEAGIEFIVLDRPNPLGGERIEGPLVQAAFRSMVSQWNVPYVYGLTCGELAQMINGERWIKARCRLTVVPMHGWKRRMTWRDTNLPWVPTSPHIPHSDSPLFQVATGMLGEIGGVSTGIGYTLPFQCIAAPGLDGHKLAAALNSYHLHGVIFYPITYKPYYFAYKDEQISGVQIYFTDPAAAPLMAINCYAVEALKQCTGRDLFAEAAHNNKSFSMFDKVSGSDSLRRALESGASARALAASWKPAEDAFRKQRRKYLLY